MAYTIATAIATQFPAEGMDTIDKNTKGHDMRERSVAAVAWFSILIHAKELQNHVEAAEAIKQLRTLGVIVKFQRDKEGN